MDTEIISQYREATWPAVKEKILAEKGIEEDDNLPDERSDSRMMKEMILKSLLLLDEVDKTELKEGQTRESVLRDEVLKNAGQDVLDGLKEKFSVLEIEAEEVEPETIDTVFYTSLYFTVKYEQDTDGKEEDTETAKNETESISKSETTESSSEEKSEELSSSKSTVFSRGLLKSGASLFSSNAPATDVTINFITADFVSGAKKESDKYVWTPVNASSDHMFVFRINYSISGVGDIVENGFQITIPKQILKDRDGNYADSYALSVPQKDDTLDDTDPTSEYAFREEGDNLIIFNCKEITAAQNGYFDVGYSTTKKTYSYVDMSESDPFVATLGVDGKSATTDEIPVYINTGATIRDTRKYYPDFYREWQSSWGTAPADAGDYYYLVWMIGTYVNDEPTQDYNFTLDDVVSSEYGSVEVAGYKMSGQTGFSMNNTVSGIHLDGYRYDYVLTRHPKSEFEPLDFYQIDNKITATVDPADGVDEDTTAVSSRSFQWSKPTFTIPTGHFNIWKWGNENWRRRFGYYWDYASYELDKLQEAKVSSLDGIKYFVEATGYPYPWTLEKGKYSDDPTAYGKNPVTYTITDDTLYLVDEDDTLFKVEDYEEPEDVAPLSSDDYDFEYLTYQIMMSDAVYNDEDKAFDISSHAKNDQDILTFFVKADGAWTEAGTVNLGTGACSITDTHVKSLTKDRIDFNEGVDGYRVETTNAYWNTTFYIYPYVSLKGTESVMEKIQRKDTVLLKNIDNLSVTYDGNFDGNADEEIVNISKVIGDRLRRVEKNSSVKKNVVSTSNNVRKKYYDIGWKISEEEIMTTGRGQKDYIRQNGGVFYDLLPEGSTLQSGTVAVETEEGFLKDSAFSYETTADYNGSGRTLLTVRIKPQAQYYRVYFHTRHPWDSIKDFGENVLNPVAYETGNEEIYNGYPDDGGNLTGQNKTYLTNLDKDTDDVRFLYSESQHWINALTAAISGLNKKVMTVEDNDWSYETMTKAEGTYMYRMRFANNFTSSSKDMIFFDSLENYKVNGVTESEWHGTLQSIDLTQLRLKGIEPVVYLSSVEDLDLNAHHDVTDTSIWTRMESFGDLSDAKAVAIDIRKTADGEDFILEPGGSVSAVLYMKAPATIAESIADYPKTYNNIYISDTVIDEDNGESSYFIHQDYTTVKYRITGDFSLEKVSEEDAGEKIEGISFRLSGTSDYGTEVNLIKETDQNGWIDFKDVEKGTYVLQEYGGIPDWLEDHTEHEVTVHGDRSVTIDETDHTDAPIVITNKPRIHTDISFLKKDLTKKTRSLAGAKFKLSGVSDYGNDILMYAISDETGKVLFENVELGTYELKEVEPPKGYIADPDVYTVVVDENANFSITGIGELEKTEEITKYSHTPNISDDGTQNSNYSNSMSTNEVVKIEGAENLHVKIVYGGESANYDWVCMWQGEHSNYTAYSNHSSSITGKLGGTSNTKEYDVEGDTVTLAFRSDGSGVGNGYGYYAVITGEVRSSYEGLKFLDSDKKGNFLFYNEPLHNFRLVKKSSYDGNTVSGATFQLKGVSDYGTTVDITDTSETNGFIDFSGLESGVYVLTETKAPAGFRLDETKRIVTISKTGEITIEGLSLNEYGNFDVVNQKIPEGQVTVIKKWQDNLSPEERVLPVIHIAGEEPEITYTGEATIGKDQWAAMQTALSMTSTAITFQQYTGKASVAKILREHSNAQKVDDGATDKSIYVWSDDAGNFYWWTDAEKTYLAKDSSSMFYNCSSLTGLDLSSFDTSNVTGMGAMFRGCSNLTSLDVSNFNTSKVTLMNFMFYGCSNLTSLDVANFDTSKVISMYSMFSVCSNLTSLDVSNFDTSKVTNMNSMFSVCSNLTSLDVSNFDTSNVMSMSCMFYGCSSLSGLDLANFDTSSVTNMESMFYNCKKLTNLDLSNFDTSKVTNMSNMFYYCTGLTSLDVSNFDTSKVTNMYRMFYICSSLTSLDLSNFDTTSATNMKNMFNNCSSLTSLDVTNFDTSRMTDMRSMFAYCSSLTSLDLTNFDTSSVTNMESMFNNCTSLTNLNLSNFDTSSVTNMDSMFYYCSSLTNLDLSSFDTSSVTDTSSMFRNCKTLATIYVSDLWTTANITSSGYMFYLCTSLPNFDSSTIDKTNAHYGEGGYLTYKAAPTSSTTQTSLFAKLSNTFSKTEEKLSSNLLNQFSKIKEKGVLAKTKREVILSKILNTFGFVEAQAATVVPGDAIASGTSGTCTWYIGSDGELVIGPTSGDEGTMASLSGSTSGVPWYSNRTSITSARFEGTVHGGSNCKYMFYNCSNMVSQDLTGFDTSKVTNMSFMFSDCSSLTSLDVSGFDTSKVTSMTWMFYNCSSLTNLDVSSFDTSSVTNMSLMFSECSSLMSLDLSGFDTSNVTSMNHMFHYCSKLTSLDVSGFDTSNVTSMNHMFSYCSKLTSLDVSGFDTSNVTSMSYMFSYCSKLSKIKIGETFSFKGNNITSTSSQALLPTPSPTGTEDGAYTGNWTKGTPYNHTDAVTPTVLRDTYDGTAMADAWYWEKNGEEPLWQSYSSISSHVFDPSAFTVTDDMTEEQKSALITARDDLLASYQIEDADGNAGYWTHIDDNTDMYTFYVYDADIDWYVWEDDAGMDGYIIDHDLIDPALITASAADKTATITNRSANIPETPEYTGSLSLTKSVVDTSGNDIADTKEFTFQIILKDADGKELSGATIYGDTAFVNGRATVNLKDDETVTFADIPEGYQYSVTESEKNGYTSVIDQPEGVITRDTTVAVTATNTYEIPPTSSFVDFTLEKKITGHYETAEEEYTFYIALDGLSPETTYNLSDGTSYTSDKNGSADISVKLKADESVTVQIPAGASYSVTEEAGDYTSAYKITDSAGLSKIRKDSDSVSEKNKQLSTATETADDGENVTITYTNTLNKTQDLKLVKNVVSPSGKPVADNGEYSIDLCFANVTPNLRILSTIGPIIADDDGIVEMTVTIRNNEEILFYDLPVGTTYQFTELANDKKASFQIMDANGGTSIVTPTAENNVENKDIATDEETVNENEDATVTFINAGSMVPCSIKLIKKDDQNLLPGVVFQLYDSENNLVSEKTTDAAGEVLFEELEPGIYTAKETQTVKGHTLLTSPITIEVPFVISKADAEAANVDVSNAVYSAADDTYSFYDIVYTVTNDTALTLPHTGDPKANLFMAVWLIASLGLLILSGKKLKKTDA